MIGPVGSASSVGMQQSGGVSEVQSSQDMGSHQPNVSSQGGNCGGGDAGVMQPPEALKEFSTEDFTALKSEGNVEDKMVDTLKKIIKIMLAAKMLEELGKQM